MDLIFEHLMLVAVAVAGAAAIGVPVGVLLTRRPALSGPVLALANVFQTIPSLALFGFLIPILGVYGIGRVPALIALFLYALLPIVRNTFTGIRGVDPAVRDAAIGMGMTDGQILRLVELPLAASVIVAGLRVATVISVGTATIAAAVGAGGLGTLIFRGLRMNDNSLILQGAVPAAAMALAADALLGWLSASFAPGASRMRAAAAKAVAGLIAAGLLISSGLWAWTGSKAADGATGRRPIVVTAKDFTEQVILGEILAQALEAEGVAVERQFELGGDLCHRGLVSGQLDVYVEYTGTMDVAILKNAPLTDPRAVYDRVAATYASKFGLEVGKPLGYDNTYAILVRGDDARRLDLRTVSDAARYAPTWRAGFGQDFVSRADGYKGFSKAYGLKFREAPAEMELSLTYRALASGQVDLIAGNATDGLIESLGLVQLEDDRRYFPPYEAVPVYRRDALEREPALGRALDRIAGKITNTEMRRMNLAVDDEKRSPHDVAAAFLAGVPR